MSYEDFNDAIKKAGEETALLIGSKCKDWFQYNAANLAPPIEERNKLLHALHSSSDLPQSIADSMCITLHCLNKNVNDKVLIAKACWAAHLCSKIHNMLSNPRVAWEYIRLLTGGTTVHHKKKVQMAMKMADGKLKTDGKENMAVFGPHLTVSSITIALLTKPYSTTSPNAKPSMTLTTPSLSKKLMSQSIS
jgi:hypothetical protein